MVLEVRSLTKAYANRPILRGVGFEMAAGERAALLGPSGSGKTTLLNCIGGVDRADSGEVIVAGEKLHALDADGLARVRRTIASNISRAGTNITATTRRNGESRPKTSRAP
jgi:ABC-type lipoprotein export system ATPase subunit